MSVIHRTARLTLRPWRDADGDDFAALNADPLLTQDLGGPMDRAASDAKLQRYRAIFDRAGFARLAIEDAEGRFIGYAGLMPLGADHPLGAHVDIGWRLIRSAWGQGYATEAARAVLEDAFRHRRLPQVIACTDRNNLRSQAVMARLGMRRTPSLDFDEPVTGGLWHGLVWVARPEDWA